MTRDLASENVWVIVPAYNEATVIGGVVHEIRALSCHVLVVDDGSHDNTLTQAIEAGAVALRHPVNLGQGAALQTGISYALLQGAEYIATFDADGQHEVTDILAMLGRMEEGDVDVVLGSRFVGRVSAIPPGRRLLLRAALLFTRLTTGLALTDSHNGLRLFSRQAAESIRLYQNRMAHASEILEQIAQRRLRYVEIGNTVRYTSYSMAKGQKATNAINIVLDLLLGRLRK